MNKDKESNGGSEPDPEFLSFVTKQLNQLPLLLPILKKLGIKETVDKYCPMDRETEVTHGLAMEILILNRFMAPKPMYKVEEWLTKTAVLRAYQGYCGQAKDTELEPERFNDDRLARALDAVAPHIQEIESEVALRVITTFNLDSRLIHFDLTSVYFEGLYEEEEGIVQGYSRDHRPDAVQATLGLDVVGEGCPVGHKTHEGNCSDSRAALKDLMQLKERLDRSDFILVGDQGSITRKNIFKLEGKADRYLGKLRKDEEAKELIAGIPDHDFAPLVYVNTTGSTYQGVEVEVTIEADKRIRAEVNPQKERIKLRGLVVKSDHKARKDNRRRERYLKKHRKALEGISSKLNQRKYKDPCYVRRQVDNVLKGSRYRYFWTIEVKGEYGEVEFNYRLKKDKVIQDKKLAGKYLIVTNVDEKELSKDELFQAYKNQHVAEARFRNLKTDLVVRPIYLEKEERIKALIFAVVLALMVYCLLEILWRRKGNRETARRLLEIFEGVEVAIFNYQGSRLWRVGKLRPDELRILRGLGFPLPEEYVNGR